MNMVHTSLKSVLLEHFSRSCYQSEMGAIKCKMCPGNQITKTVHQWHSRTEPSHQNMTKQADCEPCGWDCYQSDRGASSVKCAQQTLDCILTTQQYNFNVQSWLKIESDRTSDYCGGLLIYILFLPSKHSFIFLNYE